MLLSMVNCATFDMLILVVFATLCVLCSAKPPNIVFILTDDQDKVLGSQNAMKKTTELIGNQGIVFNNMFVSSPLCCPSRSSIFSGKYVHNHMAVNNSVNGNCSSRHWQEVEEPNAFPVYLQQQGYKTFFSGKYLNQYGYPVVGGVQHIPPGWDSWVGLVGNSVYYNYHLSVNGTVEAHGTNYQHDYLTDVIHRRGIEFLEQQTESDPFFMMLSTPACHKPFTPAPQYENNFSGMVAPRNGSYNKHGDKGKHWLIRQAITPIPNDTVVLIDDIFRNRWRTLLSVDDMVEDVFNKVKDKNMLDNTYFIFSSDNGFHLGQFSMPYDKRQLYEFDIRVPLMVRGPGIKPGQVSDVPVMNIDLGPTFIDLSGGSVPEQMDGTSFVSAMVTSDKTTERLQRENFLIEHYGEHHLDIPGCPQFNNQGVSECDCHCECQDSWNNTFSCLRVIGSGLNYKYCHLEDLVNFVEVYNLDADPNEFTNIVNTTDPVLITAFKQELNKLSLCSGLSCSTPPLQF